MKATIITAVLAFLLCTGPVLADSVTLEPTPPDLYDLAHSWYYTWGFDLDVPEITAATLRFDNIRNWNDSSNQLYVHLLDWAPAGVHWGYDGGHGGDHFAGQGVELVTYINLPSTPQDLVYEFTADEIAAFNTYIDNGGDAALGFDPDCHFYNCGISLDVTYVPEPISLVLLAGGGALLLARRKR